jgi:hypothetical protein
MLKSSNSLMERAGARGPPKAQLADLLQGQREEMDDLSQEAAKLMINYWLRKPLESLKSKTPCR